MDNAEKDTHTRLILIINRCIEKEERYIAKVIAHFYPTRLSLEECELRDKILMNSMDKLNAHYAARDRFEKQLQEDGQNGS